MSAGDISHAVCQSHNGKTEGQSRQDVATSVFGVTSHQHGGSTANSYKNKCADEFGDEFASACHNNLLY